MKPPNRRERFDLEPGSLPDMICGVNGEKFTMAFRPTHFTAVWADGLLVEVKVWGPHVRKDGSLGKRNLDHCWKKSAAADRVTYADLPGPVASRLRSYSIENG